jgi:enolase
MSTISGIEAIEVLDSRGMPTIQAKVILDTGTVGTAMVPSGASTGVHEAFELRDGDKRFQGRGVLKAIGHIHTKIMPALIGKTMTDLTSLDQIMIALDGTAHRTTLGANAILAVSLAAAKAKAMHEGQDLYMTLANMTHSKPLMPVPYMNVLNGGVHADNALSIQEFMIVPHGFSSFAKALQAGVEIYHTLKGLLKREGLSTNVGDEGGFAPKLQSMDQACSLLVSAIKEAGYQVRTEVSLALDLASSEFYQDHHYRCDGVVYDGKAWVAYLARCAETWPILSMEDACAEDDWGTWQLLTERLGRMQLVGDDLFVTQSARLARGIEQQVANTILIKPNQVGTLSETLDCIALAKKHGYRAMLSHRSGDTEDTTIADMAVGLAVGAIKTGAPCRSERVAKYNRLLEIAAMHPEYPYAGQH